MSRGVKRQDFRGSDPLKDYRHKLKPMESQKKARILKNRTCISEEKALIS